jgi:hypothetical protein
MFSQFLLDLTTFASAGILCMLPIAEVRTSPPVLADGGPVMSRPAAKRFPAPAVVQPKYEFQLVKGPRLKRRKDDWEPRPAWILLYFVVLAVLYLYHYDMAQVQTFLIAPIVE